MSMAADPQMVETPARLPKPGDVDWFLAAADRARAAKALRMTVEAPTIWGCQQKAFSPRPAPLRSAPRRGATPRTVQTYNVKEIW